MIHPTRFERDTNPVVLTDTKSALVSTPEQVIAFNKLLITWKNKIKFSVDSLTVPEITITATLS